MKCFICNHENSEDSLFCMGCGSRIPRCPSCGRVLTGRDRFCMYDGTVIPEEILKLIPEETELVTVSSEPEQVLVPTAAEEDTFSQVLAGVENSVAEDYPKAFCMNCGKPVYEDSDYCPACQAAANVPVAAAPVAFCMNCGKPCEPGQDLCEDCAVAMGYAATPAVEPQVTRRPRKKKKKTGLIVALILLLLLLVGGIALGFAISNGDLDLPFLSADKDDDRDSDDEEENTDDEGESEGAGEGEDDEDQTGEGEDVTSGDDAVEDPTEAPTEEMTEEPTEEETEPETEPEEDRLVYFVENCDHIYFTEADIEGFTAEECRIARNACYAHSGRMFNDAALQAYYEQFDWYEPIYTPENFPANALNGCQTSNIQLITAYEQEMGYR